MNGGGETQFTDREQDMFKVIALTSAVPSLFASAFVVACFIWFEKLRNHSYKLIVMLAFCNFMSSLAYIAGLANLGTIANTPAALCTWAGAASQFFDVAAYFWTACVALNVYLVFSGQLSKYEVERFTRGYHMVCWGAPAVLTAIALIFDVFGDAGNWCWITQDHQALRFVLYYMPMVLTLVFEVVIYRKTVLVLGVDSELLFATKPDAQHAGLPARPESLVPGTPPRFATTRSGALLGPLAVRPQTQTSAAETLAPVIAFRLQMYMVLFVFVRLWSVINRIQNVLNPSSPSLVLYFLHSAASPMHGLLNAVLYGMNRSVRTQLAASLEGCCCCPRRARRPFQQHGVASKSGQNPKHEGMKGNARGEGYDAGAGGGGGAGGGRAIASVDACLASTKPSWQHPSTPAAMTSASTALSSTPSSVRTEIRPTDWQERTSVSSPPSRMRQGISGSQTP